MMDPVFCCNNVLLEELTATCEPLFKLLKKNAPTEWTDECQQAFDKIKEYLLNPPVLVPPTPGRSLLMYLTVLESSMGCVPSGNMMSQAGKKEPSTT